MKKITVLILLAIAALYVSCSSNSYKNTEVSLPNLLDRADGVYRGEYSLSGTPVRVVLDVILKNHTITSINIVRHVSSPIGKKAERIIEDVIEQQSLNVDVVSGATGSSIAILKATENALQ